MLSTEDMRRDTTELWMGNAYDKGYAKGYAQGYFEGKAAGKRMQQPVIITARQPRGQQKGEAAHAEQLATGTGPWATDQPATGAGPGKGKGIAVRVELRATGHGRGIVPLGKGAAGRSWPYY